MSQDVAGISGEQLKNFIESIEKLEVEKEELNERVKEIFGEAKSSGFDVKIMRQIIRMRKMEQDELREQEELIDLYRSALGDL